MTANMFYRRDLLLTMSTDLMKTFPQSFREDTDLAWRVMEFGRDSLCRTT